MITFPRIWEIIEGFKFRCSRKGWRVNRYNDLIDANGKYHYIVWIRRIYPKTFNRVTMNFSIPVRSGLSYRRIPLSYIAWVSHETVDKNLLRNIMKSPNLLRRVAIYDLSHVYKGEKF